MGYEGTELVIHATLDRHGGDKQERDNDLWEELKQEIEKLLEKTKYKPISARIA
jgi:hypothetical protein